MKCYFMVAAQSLVVLALYAEQPVRGDHLVQLYAAVSNALLCGTLNSLMLVFVHPKPCAQQVRTTQALHCQDDCNYGSYEEIPEIVRPLLVEEWRMDVAG